MLKQLLRKRERTLREKDELFLRQNLPKEVTPLYIQLLCRQFQKRHSFDCMPLILPIGTKESIFLQLKVPNSNYEKLYKYIIGYLALAVDGLSEHCHHSMIHVCDNSGCWVCHEQLQIEILDFNVIDNTIYVLPQDLSAPIRLDIVSV